MSKFSVDKLAEIDAQIARLNAIYPNITGKKISETLGLDHNFVNRRKKKIDRASAEAIRNMTVEQDLGDIRSFLNSTLPELAKIIFDKDANNRDKINAMRTIFAGKTALLDKKFDAGVFERQIGKIKTENNFTPESQELIKQALNYAFHPNTPTKYLGGGIDEPVNEEKIS